MPFPTSTPNVSSVMPFGHQRPCSVLRNTNRKEVLAPFREQRPRRQYILLKHFYMFSICVRGRTSLNFWSCLHCFIIHVVSSNSDVQCQLYSVNLLYKTNSNTRRFLSVNKTFVPLGDWSRIMRSRMRNSDHDTDYAWGPWTATVELRTTLIIALILVTRAPIVNALSKLHWWKSTAQKMDRRIQFTIA